MPLKLSIEIEKFPIAGKFIIARGSKTEAVVISVKISDGKYTGRGECVPYARYGETVENVASSIEGVRKQIEAQEFKQNLLPPGAARNAVDSALWDLEAKRSGVSAFEKAGVINPQPVTTAYTISLDTPEKMAEMTLKAAHRPILKIKLGGADGDLERIRAVREAAPNSILIADANEGWSEANLQSHLKACADAGFKLIEQPVPAAKDELLRVARSNMPRGLILCADESVHDRASLERLVGLYDAVNIKLDKTGGPTEALALAEAARAHGFQIMVGCMVGTSLAMAPAMLLTSQASFVDLDGPLLLAKDRDRGLRYEGSVVYPPNPELWG